MHPITALQTEFSLWTRDVEADGVLATVRELGIGFVAYSPLGRGFLTGKVSSLEQLAATDFRRHTPRMQGEHLVKNQALLAAVEQVAVARGAARNRQSGKTPVDR